MQYCYLNSTYYYRGMDINLTYPDVSPGPQVRLQVLFSKSESQSVQVIPELIAVHVQHALGHQQQVVDPFLGAGRSLAAVLHTHTMPVMRYPQQTRHDRRDTRRSCYVTRHLVTHGRGLFYFNFFFSTTILTVQAPSSTTFIIILPVTRGRRVLLATERLAVRERHLLTY